jgi:hypothetical protein
VRFVKTLHEAADVIAHDARQRNVFGRNDGYVDVASAKRRRHLQTDESGADDDCAPPFLRLGDDRPAIGCSAEIVDMRLIASWNRQANGISAGR